MSGSMSITPDEFSYVRNLVSRESAIQIDEGQEYLVEARLGPLVSRFGLNSLSELIAELRSDISGACRQKIVEALTTNETFFFRDVVPFEMLKKFILPELIEKRRAERKLRIWCAGCSTGQEPYSIAIVVREHFPQLSSWDLEILATDISTQALARTAAASYTQMEVNRGLPAGFLVKHFVQEGTHWTVNKGVKALVKCRHFNMAQSWPALGPQDVIFMRNVLIYFNLAVRQEILGKARRILRPDGRLFLGSAETTLNLDPAYEQVQHGKAVCYKLKC
jgi:chemotaxis protein methyltransferase CheR